MQLVIRCTGVVFTGGEVSRGGRNRSRRRIHLHTLSPTLEFSNKPFLEKHFFSFFLLIS